MDKGILRGSMLAIEYDFIRKGSLIITRNMSNGGRIGLSYPVVNISIKHADYSFVPSGQDAELNGIFNYFFEDEFPVLRVIDPVVSIWQHSQKVVIDFNLQTKYQKDSVVLLPKTTFSELNLVIEGELERAFSDQNLIELRDYRGCIDGKSKKIDLHKSDKEEVEKYMFEYFGIKK